MTTPIGFGPASRALRGIHHRPDRPSSPPVGVLLCNPFGQEAVRSHRLFRVLADRLARNGRHVLRFDYHGTGDSPGEDEDGELDGWRGDIAVAHAELLRQSDCSRVVWAGARLGATLALMAAHDARRSATVTQPPAGVLAWEPVTDGRAYLAELSERHEASLETSYSIVPATAVRRPDAEAMGFSLGTELRRQLASLEPGGWLGADAGEARAIARVVVSPSRGASPANRLPADAGSGIRRVLFDHDFAWNSEEAIYTAPLVPPDGLRMMLEQIEALA